MPSAKVNKLLELLREIKDDFTVVDRLNDMQRPELVEQVLGETGHRVLQAIAAAESLEVAA